MTNGTQQRSAWQRGSQALFHAALLLGALAGTVLAAIGLIECGTATLVYFGAFAAPADVPASSYVLARTLKGLEFLFLAPLPYLVLFSMRSYIEHLVKDAAKLTAEEHESAHNRLNEVKSFIVSIIVAIMATDMVSRVLGHDSFGYEVAIPRILGIAVLAAYFVLSAARLLITATAIVDRPRHPLPFLS